MKVIVFTRKSDGGVSLRIPSPRCIANMGAGGRWGRMPRGFVATQIERHIADGRDPDSSRRFVHALAFGGHSTSEAFEIISDWSALHLGRQIEAFDRSEIPADRWFRDAWSRSHNGGPIGIDLEAARLVHWSRIREAVNDENKRRREAFEPLRPIAPPWNTIRSAIKHARDEDELRRVWLPELSKH